MTDFDSQIEGSSNARVGIVCHRDTWGLKVKEACNRAGITNVTKIYTELSKVEQSLDFDVVFIAEDYYSNVTGGELLDSLLSNKKLKATTAIVMVGNQGETVVHNYDSAILLLDFLPRVFSQAQLEQTISKMLLAQRTFFGVLSFVSSGRLAFAYKNLTNLDKSRVDKSLIHEFCKLQVNLAFELGKYKKVLSICDNPKLQEQDWTVWPRFKANYELGNWQYCQDSIQKREFTALPAGPMKLFWQLRILIEQDKFAEGLELLDAYPKKDMSLSMIRLAFSLMSVSGDWQQAEAFIARKVRLAQSAPQMQATLINTQCTMYLYKFFAASSDQSKQKALSHLELLLSELRQHKMVHRFKYSIEVFDIYLAIAKLGQDSDPLMVQALSQRLSDVEGQVTSPILLLRVAYAWHLLGQAQHCFSTLLNADCAFGYTPFGCERLLLAMMFKRILFNIYPEPQRATVFKQIGEHHHEESRFKLACKAFSRSLQQQDSEKNTLELLKASMSSAGMDMFAGYQLTQSVG